MKKNWKAITIDYAALLDFEDEIDIGICLTQRQVAILKSLLIPAYWATRWQNLSISQDVLEKEIADIDFRLDGNGCEVLQMDYRDNPNDPCEVQYSKDGGSTWLTMFRKDVCTRATANEITQIYIDIDNIDTDIINYAGDIINIAPLWEYTDPIQDNALCYAIGFYVDMVCDFAIAQIESHNEELRDSNNWIDDLGNILAGGIIGVLTSLPATPITLPVIFVTALTWATVGIVNIIWDMLVGIDGSAFEDEDTRQIVKCAMFQAIQGNTPQFNLWENSLSDWSSFGGNEEIIASTVNAFNSVVEMYVEYLQLMAELNDIAAFLPVCPCPATWSHTWDFENVGMEAWIITDYGSYQAGSGVVNEIVVVGGPLTLNLIQGLKLDETIPRCDRMQILCDIVRGDFDDPGLGLRFTVPPKPGEDWNNGHITTTTDRVFSYSFPPSANLNFSMVEFMNSCGTEVGTNYGSLVIKSITLSGDGVDPFAGRITS